MAWLVRKQYAKGAPPTPESTPGKLPDLSQILQDTEQTIQLPGIPVLITMVARDLASGQRHYFRERSAIAYRTRHSFRVLVKNENGVRVIILPDPRQLFVAGSLQGLGGWDGWLNVKEMVYRGDDAQEHLPGVIDVQEMLFALRQFPRQAREIGLPRKNQLVQSLLAQLYGEHKQHRCLFRNLLRYLFAPTRKRPSTESDCFRACPTVLQLIAHLLQILPKRKGKVRWNYPLLARALGCDPKALAANILLVHVPLRSLLWMEAGPPASPFEHPGSPPHNKQEAKAILPGLPYLLWVPLSRKEEQNPGSGEPDDWMPIAYSKEHVQLIADKTWPHLLFNVCGSDPEVPCALTHWDSHLAEHIVGQWEDRKANELAIEHTDAWTWNDRFRHSGLRTLPFNIFLLLLKVNSRGLLHPCRLCDVDEPVCQRLAFYATLQNKACGAADAVTVWTVPVDSGNIASLYAERGRCRPLAYLSVEDCSSRIRALGAHASLPPGYLWVDHCQVDEHELPPLPSYHVLKTPMAHGDDWWPMGLSYESSPEPPFSTILKTYDYLCFRGQFQCYFVVINHATLSTPPPADRLVVPGRKRTLGETNGENLTERKVQFNKLRPASPVAFACQSQSTCYLTSPWGQQRKRAGNPFTGAGVEHHAMLLPTSDQAGWTFGLLDFPQQGVPCTKEPECAKAEENDSVLLD